ncbi:MAG TPA: calcium-binding protein [Rhizomicrobium sp.]|nr:calcium-binding protein [Rhizomicrobium sp.]
MNFKGTSGDDNLTGTSGDDVFNMSQGGDDIVAGGGGDDVFQFGAAMSSGDEVNGGAGNDTLVLKGNYGASYLSLSSVNLVSVEAIVLDAGFSYELSLANSVVAAGASLTVNAGTLGAGNQLTFDDSAEADGSLVVKGGAGDDTIYGGRFHTTIDGGAGNDSLNLYGGTNIVQAGAGNDNVAIYAPLSADTRIDGGTGTNQLFIDYDTSATGLVLNSHLLKDFDTLVPGGGLNHRLIAADSAVPAGQTLFVYANGLSSSHTLNFNGSKETDGAFYLQGGAGNDVLTGGHGNDGFEGRGGADRMTGGAGADTFYYDSVSDSTGKAHDVITDFDAAHDIFGLAVDAVDATVAAGALDPGKNFDSELAAAIGSGQLAAHDAVLFKPDSGALAGHTFVIVDANGVAGYQAGQDYVIQIDGVNALTVDANFT